MDKKTLVMLGVLAMLLVVALPSLMRDFAPDDAHVEAQAVPDPDPPEFSDTRSEDQQAAPRIAFREVERWAIPPGSFGRTIVIDQSTATEGDLRKLGDQLREELRDEPNSIVFIFNDERAARMRKDVTADSVSAEDAALYDRHFVGIYSKNGNTGFHRLAIHAEGLNGSTSLIDY